MKLWSYWNDAQVKKNVADIGPFYPKLVMEFIVNQPKWFNDPGSVEIRKVHVHEHCFWILYK